MAAEYDTKAVLLDWMKQGENRHCSECNLPSPQWCSLSYGTTLCLTCSGTHRSLGVHLSFVRSLTMDKWTPPQIERMLKGGNQKAREFFEASGQVWKSDNLQDKYNSHVAAMYRDKLLADAEGRPWIPTDTPATSTSSTHDSSASSSSSQGLRKPRAQNNRSSNNSSPRPYSDSPSTSSSTIPNSQKAQNENYFARLGNVNNQRSTDLPPSQGGKYSGFGSQPQPQPSAGGISPLSSRALPRLDDLRDDPVGALGKGWGFLGAALGAVGKTVNESVIQPGLERAHDPALQSQFTTFLSTAQSSLSTVARQSGQVLSTGLETSSQFLRRDLGVDVGDLGAHYLDQRTGRGAGEGYGRVGEEWAPRGINRQENNHAGEGDFFEDQLSGSSSSGVTTPQIGGGRGSSYRDGREEGEVGFQEMPTVRSTSSTTTTSRTTIDPLPAPPAPPPPQIEGDWNSFAPKAAAARKAAEAAAAAKSKEDSTTNKKKDEDGWGDFDDF